jgi:hypothetical protein
MLVRRFWPDFCSLRVPCHASMTSVDAVTVGRNADGLRFSELRRGPDGEIWRVKARLRVAGLDASLQVSAHYATGFAELAEFFRGLASDWRGWPGERVYQSLEHDLRLAAVHDGFGHVRLAVQLRQSSLPDGWSAAAVIWLDPGEELSRAAEDVAAMLSPPEP